MIVSIELDLSDCDDAIQYEYFKNGHAMYLELWETKRLIGNLMQKQDLPDETFEMLERLYDRETILDSMEVP